jgi:hypothetical protein
MISSSKTLKYDKQTGIATNGYTGYFRALQDENGNYCKVSKWSKGDGIYSISDDNKICVDISINITYNSIDTVQNAGQIHFELSLNENNKFYITERTVVFVPNKNYRVASPKTTAQTSWSYTETNQDKSIPSTKDTVIDWISYDTEYDASVISKAVNLSTQSSEIKNVSKIEVTESKIVLTSKDGFTFSESVAKKGDFSVIANKGTEQEFDIAYKASIKTSGKHQTLTITFDKSYPQDEITSLTINY